ncbi:TetR/AcrR family transcriptional regulator [Sunxiuqinia sp. A32]|uniref:TetR/AcrR family transcriptional regulator n=1 Tax=Sunxiuqinia sp. A32 TaxID=3461496 RepID=UPI0040453BE2
MMNKDEIAKQDILVHAQKLFQQFGLKKTTMDEIAASCGKAKSTLYHYFTSKDEVYDAVIFMEMTNLRKLVKDRVEEQKSLIDKIKTYTMEFYREVISKVNLYRLIQKDNDFLGVSKKYFLQMMEFEQSYIIGILEDGYDSGEYSSVEKEDIPWVAEMFLATFYGVVQYAIEKDGFCDEERIRKTSELLVPNIFV